MTTPQAEARAISPEAVTARTIFLKWEWLRVLYNANLLVVVIAYELFVGDTSRFRNLAYFIYPATRASMANLLFMAGPAVEAYANWLGLRVQAIRPLLFLAGLILSIGLTCLSLAMFGVRFAD
jgi:hypothetical protein